MGELCHKRQSLEFSWLYEDQKCLGFSRSLPDRDWLRVTRIKVETSVTVYNSSVQNYVHPDDHAETAYSSSIMDQS